MPAWRLRLLRALRALFTPLLPDDYLELINPLWSTQELRGRIERIEHEAPGAVTVVIKPGWEWPGHKPGQYLRVGMPVNGIHHWRAYSITSDPGPHGRLHQHHAEAGRSGEGVPISGAHGEAGGDRPPRRSGGRIHPSRPVTGQDAVHQRG